MASQEQILNSIRNAHSAGDEEAARRFAVMLQHPDQTSPPPQQIQVPQPPLEESVFDTIDRYGDNILEMVTGSERSTPEIENLPDIFNMPMDALNGIQVAGTTLTTSPEETASIIAETTGAEMRQDEKGNYILKSPKDGQEYAIKPGFRMSDIPRVVGGMLAFAPAAGAKTVAGVAAASGGIETINQIFQKMSGGKFDLSDIGLSSIFGAAGKGLQKGLSKVSDLRGPSADVASDLVEEGAAAGGVMTADEIAKTTQQATKGFGKQEAIQKLAGQALPDSKTVQAAERLGIAEYLQPDHVTTNENFAALNQVIKSADPLGPLAQGEKRAIQELSSKADDLISDLGGTKDLSQLNVDVKRSLEDIQQGLLEKSKPIYEKINQSIPPKTEAPANNVLQYINKKADDLGGAEFLDPVEKTILNQLNPSNGKPPTYARLEKVRKDLTASRVKKQGVFKDADSALTQKLEDLTMMDQRSIVDQFGLGSDFEVAQRAVAMRKGVEKDLTALLGKELDGSIVTPLATGVKNLSKGDVKSFTRLINSVPQSIRKEVTASGLSTAFSAKAQKSGLSYIDYTNWYEGIIKNKQARNAIFSNLDKDARKQLQDLYRVSRGVRQSRKEFISTGRIETVSKNIENIDGIANKIYDLAQGSLPLEVVASASGMPGLGVVGRILGNLGNSKPTVLRLADQLVTSPDFIKLASKATPEAAKKISNLAKFKSLMTQIPKNQKPEDIAEYLIEFAQTQKPAITEDERKF